MNPITRSWIWEEYLKFISIEHGKYFLEKMYYSNSFVKWRIFSLHFPGCRCSWGTQLPWSSTWCDNASSFLCFSVWKPLAVVEILLSETATCLIPAQWFHHLQPRWQLKVCEPPPRPMTGNAHSLVAHFLVLLTWWKAKGSLMSFWLMFVIILLQLTLFCFQRIFLGDWILAEKAYMEPSYLKKISSNFILPEHSVTSTLFASQLLSCSILG